jgi:hypothetical protein
MPLSSTAAMPFCASEMPRAFAASAGDHATSDPIFPMTTRISKHLSDDHGTASLDWLADGVLYARIEGSLSAGLGAAFARTLQGQLQTAPSVHYFGDSSRLDQYDLLARSAFMRVVLADRKKFESFTLLTWAEGVSSVAQAFADLMGSSAAVLTHRDDFDRRLLRLAPSARSVIDGTSSLLRVPLQRVSR